MSRQVSRGSLAIIRPMSRQVSLGSAGEYQGDKQAGVARVMLDWMKHKLESRLPGEISIISDMQMSPSLWQKAKRN